MEAKDTIIEKVSGTKDLGIIVTNNLNWTETAKTRSAKALKALYSLTKSNISKLTTKHIKLKAYQTYVARL